MSETKRKPINDNFYAFWDNGVLEPDQETKQDNINKDDKIGNLQKLDYEACQILDEMFRECSIYSFNRSADLFLRSKKSKLALSLSNGGFFIRALTTSSTKTEQNVKLEGDRNHPFLFGEKPKFNMGR